MNPTPFWWKPSPLKTGDHVALLAPCSPQLKEQLLFVEQAMKVLEGWGLVVELQPGYDQRHFYLAGTDEHRATQFQQFYTDPRIKAIFITRGGYGASRLLRYLESSRIALYQKIVVGLSDFTTLLLYLHQTCGMVVFHGPCLATTQFIESPRREDTRQALYQALFQTTPPPALEVHTLHPGQTEGMLTGGCLSLVVSTLGTPAAIDTENRVLFLEDVNEAPYRIDRMLTHLQNAGKFASLRGLIFGEMVGCDTRDTILWPMLQDFFKDVPFPVVYGVPSGHGPFSLTLPWGVPVQIDTTQGMVSFLESGVADRFPLV